MTSLIVEQQTKTFASDVNEGLSSEPKYLSSKYFYDQKGDELFQEIMQLPGYYLTGCEYEIFESCKSQILDLIKKDEPFDLIEFGAGDGFKTKVLLKHFLDKKIDFKYMPVDISKNALNILRKDLASQLPHLNCQPLQGEYFKALEELNKIDTNKKVILFLGSNIGNFSFGETNEFLSHLSELLNKGDKVIIGFDLKKDPAIIKNAYDDTMGVTRAFNLNLLNRINRELDGDFDLTAFKHVATYDPESGEAKSFLLSTRKQHVNLRKIGMTYYFDQWESIFTEVSQKYELKGIHEFANKNGFSVVENLFDCKHYYVDSVWEKSKG